MLRKIIVSNCASEKFFELLEKENIDYIMGPLKHGLGILSGRESDW